MPKHSRVPHLELRPQGYVWRRRIPRAVLRLGASKSSASQTTFSSRRGPTDVKTELQGENSGIQTTLGGNPLCLSLKTHAFPVAAELARALTTLSEQTFLYATATMTLSPQKTTTLLTGLAEFEIEASDRARALADPRSAHAAQFALDRERALQDVLRRAFLHRDYSVAQEPLRHVARELGIELPDATTESAKLLAYEATRVMLDVSQERLRRDQGEFDQPSPYFVKGLAQAHHAKLVDQSSSALEILAADALDTSAAAALFASNRNQSQEVSTCSSVAPRTEGRMEMKSDNQNLRERLQARGVLNFCTTEMMAILEKGNAITFAEASDVYIAFKSAGFGEDWNKHQKPDPEIGARWVKSSLPAMKTATKIWVDQVGAWPFSRVPQAEIEEAISIIRRLPKYHGKGEKYTAETYRALVAKVATRVAAAMDKAERKLRQDGCTNNSVIADARLAEAVPSIRVETFMRLVRTPNKIGKMLVELAIVEENPFNICTFSNLDEKRLKATEANVSREPWDDRLDELMQSPVFQGHADGPDDPLFWMPVIAYTMGLRSEEAAQLGPEDVQRFDGIPYVMVQQDLGDAVKSANGTRKIPLHPALIELGFLELVASAVAKGQRRLFPSLTRGSIKGTYTENFTKAFHYYRRQNNVYWHGLDFHALRTTFHHHLLDMGCPGSHRRKLMGHEPLDEGEKSYAQKGISIASLYEQLRRIPFDSSRVKSPILSHERAAPHQGGLRLIAGTHSK